SLAAATRWAPGIADSQLPRAEKARALASAQYVSGVIQERASSWNWYRNMGFGGDGGCCIAAYRIGVKPRSPRAGGPARPAWTWPGGPVQPARPVQAGASSSAAASAASSGESQQWEPTWRNPSAAKRRR